jgi:CheY-like chemotaxis protein
MTKPLALIIEDDRKQVVIFSRALEMAGYQTQLFRSGEEALQTLASLTPAIIILDLHLPQVSGLQILDYIRSQERLAGSKVILATADPRRAERLQDQVDLILIKPISMIQLRDLAQRLNRSQADGGNPPEQTLTAG